MSGPVPTSTATTTTPQSSHCCLLTCTAVLNCLRFYNNCQCPKRNWRALGLNLGLSDQQLDACPKSCPGNPVKALILIWIEAKPQKASPACLLAATQRLEGASHRAEALRRVFTHFNVIL